MNQSGRRLSYGFLCAVPFIAIALVAVRSLRTPSIHQSIGALVFAAILVAIWILAAGAIRVGSNPQRMQALAGVFLVAPFALVSLLWVGLSTPWESTPSENQLRYLVLLGGAAAVSVAFVVLKEALREKGEAIWSALGFGSGILAGAAYLVWLSFQLGGWTARIRAPDSPAPSIWFDQGLDALLFVACVLTYLSTAAFAASLARVGWLCRAAGSVYFVANALAVLFLIVRGLSFPDPAAGSTPWFTRPGFIAGIPAVPWIMPHLMGVVLMRRAGEVKN